MELMAYNQQIIPSIEQLLARSNPGLPAQLNDRSLEGKHLCINGTNLTIADIYLFNAIKNIQMMLNLYIENGSLSQDLIAKARQYL